jgi:hypothetical protein
MRRLASAVLFPVVLLSFPAGADYRITRDLGGSIEEHRALFNELLGKGDRVVIDGACDSACTIVLGIIPLSRICVTERASLGFHLFYYDLALTGGDKIVSYLGTEEIISSYPPAIKDWIDRNGGLTKQAKYILAPELRKIIKRC